MAGELGDGFSLSEGLGEPIQPVLNNDKLTNVSGNSRLDEQTVDGNEAGEDVKDAVEPPKGVSIW